MLFELFGELIDDARAEHVSHIEFCSSPGQSGLRYSAGSILPCFIVKKQPVSRDQHPLSGDLLTGLFPPALIELLRLDRLQIRGEIKFVTFSALATL